MMQSHVRSKAFSLVSRLMGGSAGGTMGHAMTNMGSLAACSVSDSKPMQFPLAQRRKRRVLFTQAQVRKDISSHHIIHPVLLLFGNWMFVLLDKPI